MRKFEERVIQFIPDKKYPDIGIYKILERNPDAGKSGVSYSGEFMVVAETDGEEEARLIAAAPQMYEALKEVVEAKKRYGLGLWTIEKLKLLDEALAAAEGRE